MKSVNSEIVGKLSIFEGDDQEFEEVPIIVDVVALTSDGQVQIKFEDLYKPKREYYLTLPIAQLLQNALSNDPKED
ncbi:MAG: hypothetical protein KIS92_01040 [Planctomycetota bacterium]|nr:hypothetical protein [Planctomycetota bacterium]